MAFGPGKRTAGVACLAIACVLLSRTAWSSEPAEEGGAGAAPVVARPPPWLGVDFTLAVGGWQIALLGSGHLTVNGPLHRSPSRVFQKTYLGGGVAVEASPGFVAAGPRFSLSPVDFFVLSFEVAGITGFPQYGGFIPYAEVEGKLDADRRAREDEAVPFGQALRVRAQPVVQLRAGPVVVLYSLSWDWVDARPPADLDTALWPYVYYARRDLVIRWGGDHTFEHQGVVMGEVLDGKDGPLLRLGATARHRDALGSGDSSTVLGGIVQVKPDPRPAWPTVTVLLMPYLRDADRAAPDFEPPQANLIVALRWQNQHDLVAAARGEPTP